MDGGLATEAVRAAIEIAFVRLGAHVVTAARFAPNEASRRLMERVGMRQEAHSRSPSLHRTRGWVDTLEYALLDDEWRAAQRA